MFTVIMIGKWSLISEMITLLLINIDKSLVKKLSIKVFEESVTLVGSEMQGKNPAERRLLKK